MAPGSGGVGPGGMMQYPAQSQQQMGPAQGQSQVSDPRSDPRRSFQQMQAGQAGHVAAGDSAHNHQAYAGPAPGQMGNMLPQQSASQPNFGQVHQQQPQLQQQQQPQQPQPQQQPPSQPQQQQQAQFGLAQQQGTQALLNAHIHCSFCILLILAKDIRVLHEIAEAIEAERVVVVWNSTCKYGEVYGRSLTIAQCLAAMVLP